MCAACVYKLREAQRFNVRLDFYFINFISGNLQKDLAKQERALLIHTIVTTTAHMIKSAQQVHKDQRSKLN